MPETGLNAFCAILEGTRNPCFPTFPNPVGIVALETMLSLTTIAAQQNLNISSAHGFFSGETGVSSCSLG